MAKIERISPPKGCPEKPHHTSRGVKLADPKFGSERHHARHAAFVATLEEAADLIEKGFSIWTIQAGKRKTLISPGSLRIARH